VVGGGTAGLVVAARLTENPAVRVGVIEAGQNRMDNKQVSTPCLYPSLIGRPEYNRCISSIPQPNAGGRHTVCHAEGFWAEAQLLTTSRTFEDHEKITTAGRNWEIEGGVGMT
jgi:choline dehydrogenase-like flavoprotein